MNPLIASPTALPDPREPAKLSAMLALAERLLAGREAHRAALAEKGEAIGDGVETSIRLGRALVAQWRWVLDPAAGPLPECGDDGWWGAWSHELADDTAIAAERARQRADEGDHAATELANRCEVLAWYQHRRRPCGLARIVEVINLDRLYNRLEADFSWKSAA